MGLSASQARFLQLTARKSNNEYESQQISHERLSIASRLEAATTVYQEKMNNKKMVFAFISSDGANQRADVTYNNYKNYMNQQIDDLPNGQKQYFLVSSTKNKIVAGSEEDVQTMIEKNPQFTEKDFLVVDGLDDSDNFQKAIREGVYFFATYEEEGDGEFAFRTYDWETMGAGAISEEYDKTDDAAAQAEFDLIQTKLQNVDKKLEMRLDQLETERSALSTEMEGVEKTIEDNIENTFNVFS